jgi:hypothetical protein
VWWSWTPPRASKVTFADTSPFQSHRIEIFEGNQLAALQLVSSGQPFNADPTKAYQVRVSTDTEKVFTIAVALSRLPSNDAFERRASLPSVLGSFLSIVDFGPPGDYASRALWWAWQAPKSAAVRFEASPCLSASGVYVGTSPESLTAVAADSAGFLQFRAEAGRTYILKAETYNCSGAASLFLTELNSPSNDDYETRAQLPAGFSSFSSSAENATAQLGEPNGGKSLWWTWTAAANETVAITVSTSRGEVYIYKGDSLSTLTQVATKRRGLTASATYEFIAERGVSYSIQIVDAGFFNAQLRKAASRDLAIDSIRVPSVAGAPGIVRADVVIRNAGTAVLEQGVQVQVELRREGRPLALQFCGAGAGLQPGAAQTCTVSFSLQPQTSGRLLVSARVDSITDEQNTSNNSRTQEFSVCNLSSTEEDCDGDGVPNSIEAAEQLDAFVKDNDIFTKSRLFVMQMYRDFLQRQGDSDGISLCGERGV